MEPDKKSKPDSAGKNIETGAWGKENYPPPRAAAYIECDEMKCVGCEICQMACSMHHYGIINKDLARIQVYKYFLPISKGIPVTCCQCPDGERNCEAACPVDPPAIYYDKNLFHMVIDMERCLGHRCLKCREACPAKAISNHPELYPKPFVCDLCDTKNDGNRNPQCVNVCPTGALSYKDFGGWGFPIRDLLKKHADEKAELISKRLYPMTKDKMWEPKKKVTDE